MGIFDFLKGSGKKVELETSDDVLDDLKFGNGILRAITKNGLYSDGVTSKFHAGTVTLRGTVPDQATREKIVLLAGNTVGVERVDDQLEVVTPAPEAVFYTVKSGDTLSKIAKSQLGDAGKYPAIFEANRPMLENPDKIYPGQVLRIPSAS
ncbi:MAG TPA: peptidoglycan-binding protein LysM [Gemmatimonadales bacterium]|nr:peptidoglycan-binding protein LysM [Gemmatimonadales bacterium]